MSSTRPVRVLHIIDTLGGGGSERLVWDIVRLSDPARVQHMVVTIFPDGYLVPFVYAEPLRELGAYRGTITAAASPSQSAMNSGPSRTRTAGSKLPAVLKKPLVGLLNLGFSSWRDVKNLAVHVRSMLSVPAEYLRFKPDVVHTHGFYSFKYGLLFKTLLRCPTIHIVPALFSQMEAQGTGFLVNR